MSIVSSKQHEILSPVVLQSCKWPTHMVISAAMVDVCFGVVDADFGEAI